MGIPRRLRRQSGRFALVDGIPFELPVNSDRTSALMAAFGIDATKARSLLPGNELHPVRLWNRGVLLVTVINYQLTDIGAYIEFSIGIAVTHARRPAPRLLPFVLRGHYRFGQYVLDLPVSTEISVKGGKGIWGMPKHQANLDFVVADGTVSSQYDDDGTLAMRIEIDRPKHAKLPVSVAAANYCQFRGLLMKSYVYMRGKAGFALGPKASARLILGDHPRLAPLAELGIDERPIFTAFFPSATGVLDDYFESWFLSYDRPPAAAPEGFESVINLGLGQEWLEPPAR
jgi:Acetoacetate decarboxylase (ADC)